MVPRVRANRAASCCSRKSSDHRDAQFNAIEPLPASGLRVASASAPHITTVNAAPTTISNQLSRMASITWIVAGTGLPLCSKIGAIEGIKPPMMIARVPRLSATSMQG